jgi:hypothetical protein
MGHVCTHEQFPGPNNEHPVVAVVAVIAIIAAILLIAWARFAVHGTEDIEEALLDRVISTSTEEAPEMPRADTMPPEEREVESHVTSSRFATGFSP